MDSAPTLFLASFPELSDTIRLDFAAPGPDNYVEVDAVMLIGASSVSTAKLTSQEVVFVQDPESDFYFNGTEDQFTFTIDDSDYYMRYRELDISDATITLQITPVNDAPLTPNVTFPLTQSKAKLEIPVKDADGPDTPSVSITTLPRFGYLQTATGRISSVPTEVLPWFFCL